MRRVARLLALVAALQVAVGAALVLWGGVPAGWSLVMCGVLVGTHTWMWFRGYSAGWVNALDWAREWFTRAARD